MSSKRLARPFKRTSPASAVFAVAAIGYIGYRAFFMLGLTGLPSIINQPVKAVEIGCSEPVDQNLRSGSSHSPLISTLHQGYLYSLPAQSTNLIVNASLDTLDKRRKLPLHFTWTQKADYLAYTYERDAETNIPYLRTTITKPIAPPQETGSWAPKAIPIAPNATYVYSLSYRSTVPVTVNIAYTMPDGSLAHEPVTTLDNMSEWQRFTYYLHNTRGATAFRLMLTAREAGTVDTRDYDAHRIASASLPKGTVSITFDDGWQSVANHALPLLAKYKIATTQYIIAEASDKNVPHYMPIETLQDIKRRGHEIGSHTLTHCDQTKLDNREVLVDATESKALLERKDLGPVASYAYPYGAYDDNTQLLVSRAYPYMRTSDPGYNDRYFDARSIRSMVVTSDTDMQTLESWLNFAAKHKLWLVLTYHRIEETGHYSISKQQFEQHLQRISRSGLDIKPLAVAAKGIK